MILLCKVVTSACILVFFFVECKDFAIAMVTSKTLPTKIYTNYQKSRQFADLIGLSMENLIGQEQSILINQYTKACEVDI